MKSTTVTKLLSVGTLGLALAGNILSNILAKRQLKEAVAEEVANPSKHASETK